VVRAGETYEHENIVVEVVEVTPYLDFSKRRHLMIAYRIKNGAWTSPLAHWWQGEREDPRPIVERIVENYLAIKPRLR